MIISDTQKFIFLHIPKCGRATIRNSLIHFNTRTNYFWMFVYTYPAINVLNNWIRLLPQNPTMVDDLVLNKAFNTSNLELNTLWFPKIYNRLDRHSSYWSEFPNEEVVINHEFDSRPPSKVSSNFDNVI